MRLGIRHGLQALAPCVLLVGACGGRLDSDDRICAPGAERVCACPGGRDGVQVCSDDGRRWGTCDCTLAEASGGSSGDAAAGGSSVQDGGATDVGGGGGSGNHTALGGGAGGSGGSTEPGSGGSGNHTALGGGAGGSGGSTEPGAGGAAVGGAAPSQTEPCPGVPVDGPNLDDPGCTGVAMRARGVPVDMFILLDRSISMSETLDGEEPIFDGQSRWEGVLAGATAFVQDPNHEDVGLGIQFFSASGVGNEGVDCDVDSYTTPAVPIGPVLASGTEVVAAILSMTPNGLTPTYPALQGALEYATWHSAQPGSGPTALVLVTDGMPTECDPQDTTSIARLAGEAWQAHGVLTHVIGLSPELWPLDAIALAGGTGQALLIEQSDVATQLRDALTRIAATPSFCAYELPESPSPVDPIDYDRVQLFYDPAEGGREEIPRLDDLALCDDALHGGWTYDSSTDPRSIRACPCSCARVSAGEGDVFFALGCSTQPYPYDDS